MSEETTADAASDERGTEPEADQPGLRALREAVANHLPGSLGSGRGIRRDVIAGLNGALTSVPDGMATALLAGVNPILGLYACTAGPIAAGLLSSTALMVVVTTSSSALAAGQALQGVTADERANALWVMLLLVGLFQVGLGVLRLGRLTRFVSYSVMTGFIAGIAVLTILSQLPTATGYEANGDGNVAKAIDVAMHLGEIDVASLAVAGVALAAATLLPHTPVGKLAALVAVVVPSAAVALIGIGSVAQVRDVGDIPGGLPLPSIPDLTAINGDVLTGAIAVAAIVLIQGSGVSQSVPNPNGTRRSMSRDFIAQGVGNGASALFGGTPVGGSLSTTALTVISGATSRLAPILVGVWMAVIVIVFPDLVAYVAMPTLAAVLIVASASTIHPAEAVSLFHTGWPSRIAAVTTFLTTLFLPIQAAVGIGVALSAILYIYESASDLSIVELVKREDGRIVERNPEGALRSDDVTVLDAYGTLFFAGARKLERLLPNADEAKRAAVVLRLRGRERAGATLIEVLTNYANDLAKGGGRLHISGLGEFAGEQLERTGKVPLSENVALYPATDVVGESTDEAVQDARRWLAEQR